MKKFVSVLLVAVVAMSLMAEGAVAGKKKKPKGTTQTVEGGVLMMLPFPQDLNSCYSGAHRRAAIATQEQVNGVTGYHFDVDPGTWNLPFKLDVVGGQGAVDLDITFYSEFGTPEQATDTAYAPYNFSYEDRAPGGEVGTVPPDMNKVIICMWDGQNATFTYEAGPAVK